MKNVSPEVSVYEGIKEIINDVGGVTVVKGDGCSGDASV